MNRCHHCQTNIPAGHYFCYKHWKLMEGKFRSPLITSRKPETIQRNLANALQSIRQREAYLNPRQEKFLYYAHSMGHLLNYLPKGRFD